MVVFYFRSQSYDLSTPPVQLEAGRMLVTSQDGSVWFSRSASFTLETQVPPVNATSACSFDHPWVIWSLPEPPAIVTTQPILVHWETTIEIPPDKSHGCQRFHSNPLSNVTARWNTVPEDSSLSVLFMSEDAHYVLSTYHRLYSDEVFALGSGSSGQMHFQIKEDADLSATDPVSYWVCVTLLGDGSAADRPTTLSTSLSLTINETTYALPESEPLCRTGNVPCTLDPERGQCQCQCTCGPIQGFHVGLVLSKGTENVTITIQSNSAYLAGTASAVLLGTIGIAVLFAWLAWFCTGDQLPLLQPAPDGTNASVGCEGVCVWGGGKCECSSGLIWAVSPL